MIQRAFVLDASVALRWIVSSNKTSDQDYAEQVLESMKENDAHVPILWHLEIIHVLSRYQKDSTIDQGLIDQFLFQIGQFPIRTDVDFTNALPPRILGLTRDYKLSSYDAAYLELAMREGLSLATLDKQLRKATIKAGIEIYLD